MSGYRVAWKEGSIELLTEGAAHVLVEAFREEGREAKAYVRDENSDWVDITVPNV